MKTFSAIWSIAALLLIPLVAQAADNYEALEKKSVRASVLKRILYPFVATCDREKDHFGRLFCSALNERLKAQHQSKIYRSVFEPDGAGPLVVEYEKKDVPTLKLSVKGCLTCDKPMLAREGGDVSKARFFVFKMPQDIKVNRGKGQLYDFGDIEMASYEAKLPAKMTREKFDKKVRPFLRLELLYRPVAGTEMVGRGRYKHGVINFELVGHRVYDKCSGVVYGGSPEVAESYKVDKNDLSCPQNQPKKPVKKVKLPSALPQNKVKAIMAGLADDLGVCYQQFGTTGNVPADIVVDPSGKVKHAKVVGNLADTPAAQCVERLIKDLTFPKFRGDAVRLQWPLSLR